MKWRLICILTACIVSWAVGYTLIPVLVPAVLAPVASLFIGLTLGCLAFLVGYALDTR